MRPNALSLLVGALILASGWSLRGIFQNDAAMLAPPPSIHQSTAELENIAQQVTRIEAMLMRSKDGIDAPVRRESVESSHDFSSLVERIENLESRLGEILAKVSEASSSLEELSLARPQPIQVGIDRLFDAGVKDPSLILRTTAGMTYRDATLAFGTPTVKRDPPGLKRQGSGLPVTEWWWDVPESGHVLLVQFAGGTACWTVFTSRASLESK